MQAQRLEVSRTRRERKSLWEIRSFAGPFPVQSDFCLLIFDRVSSGVCGVGGQGVRAIIKPLSVEGEGPVTLIRGVWVGCGVEALREYRLRDPVYARRQSIRGVLVYAGLEP